MTPNEAHEALLAQFVTDWTGNVNSASVPYHFEEERVSPETEDEYVVVTFGEQGRNQHTLGSTGNRRFRSRERVVMQIFVPRNTGTQRGEELSLIARNIFEQRAVGSVDCYDSARRKAGSSGKHSQWIVSVDFSFDETR